MADTFYSVRSAYQVGRMFRVLHAEGCKEFVRFCITDARGLGQGWRASFDAADAAQSWKAATESHADTSYFGTEHIRKMRAFWLGVLRTMREES